MSLTAAYANETQLLDALRRRDEAAFVTLVDQYHGSLIRIAQMYVADRASAEEVAQETWLGVLKGIDRFEGRSSIKTWLFRILTNLAKTRGVRENRSLPFSAFWEAEAEPFDPVIPPDRFRSSNDPQWPHHWALEPPTWGEHPEERLLSNEAQAVIRCAIEALPVTQREVITLRDLEGWSSAEVCNTLLISETNQRVLLHRARSKVRRALEQYLDVASN